MAGPKGPFLSQYLALLTVVRQAHHERKAAHPFALSVSKGPLNPAR